MNDKLSLLKKINIFAALDEKELAIIEENSVFNKYSKGDIVFREGEYSNRFYIINEGGVAIQKEKDGQIINVASFIQGESFGELDLLENRPMTATAVAETDSTLLVFPPTGLNFEDILKEHPVISARMLHELLAVIAGRIRNTNKLISEKSKWIQDLKRQLYNDKLTGLYNKTYLSEEFPAFLNSFSGSVAFVMVKPDNFKQINDVYGHEGGDKALKRIADAVNSHAGTNAVLRYRGDEFAVILPSYDKAAAMSFAESMRRMMCELDFSDITSGAKITLTASVGVAMYPEDAGDSVKLVKLCFDKMFEARDSGGDRVLSVS